MSTATLEKTNTMIVPPFGVEAKHPRNCDLLIQSIPGCRLRSEIDGTSPVRDVKTGDLRVSLDQARHLASFPRVPGMQLHVNPAELTYAIMDPLHGDAEMCERIRKWMNEMSPMRTGQTVKGVPTLTGQLDVHRMKTLCRELVQTMASGEMKHCKGPKPSMDDIDELPGNYLLNPGSRVNTTQPTFEKDWDSWVEQLTRSGG